MSYLPTLDGSPRSLASLPSKCFVRCLLNPSFQRTNHFRWYLLVFSLLPQVSCRRLFCFSCCNNGSFCAPLCPDDSFCAPCFSFDLLHSNLFISPRVLMVQRFSRSDPPPKRFFLSLPWALFPCVLLTFLAIGGRCFQCLEVFVFSPL